MSWKVNSVAPSGKRHGHAVQHAAVLALEFQRHLRAVVDRGDRFAQRPPCRRVVEQRQAPGFHGLDVRLFLERFRRQLPHLRESRVEQLDAAVAAEHRDRFGEIVERLVLDPGQPVEAAREVEAFGDVVEQIGDAAFEVRRGDDAEGAAVGQEPAVALGFHGAIGFVQLGLPGPEIGLFGQLARRAQPVEHAGIVGVGVQKCLIEAPQPPVGFVVEGEPPLAVEHGNARRQLVEGAAMGLRHPLHGVAQLRGLAGVDGDAGAAAAELDRLHVIDAPLAADHDRQPRAEVGVVVQHPVHLGALVVFQQFEVAVDRIGDAGALGGPHIGRVGVTQIALDALGPDRPGRRGGEVAQQLGLFEQRPVAQIGFGEFPAQPAEFANPHNGLAADGAAHRFDGAAVRGREIEQKTFAGLAQRIDRMVHLQCRFRRQPGSEGEDALRRIRLRVLRDQKRGVPADLRPVVARRPGDQDLRLGEQQRAQAVGLHLQLGDVGAQAEFRLGARMRVRISRIAATTEKPSSDRAVVSAANSW